MARRRREEVASDDAWPVEFSMPDAAPWQGSRAFRAWCHANELQPRDESTPAARRCRAIGDWAHAHHPSRRWPGFIDQHWMNESGLRRIQQSANRDRMIHALAN